MAKTTFQDSLVERGYCDSRAAGFCAKATILDGEYGNGIVALCVKENMLNIYDVAVMSSELRELLCQVELSKIEGLKITCNIFFQVLKFKYEGRKFSFTNFFGVKPALNVIREESEK